jgi:hypothetical protein
MQNRPPSQQTSPPSSHQTAGLDAFSLGNVVQQALGCHGGSFWVTGALDQMGFQLLQKYTAEQERLCFLWGAEWYINSRLGLEVSKSDFFWKQVVKKKTFNIWDNI